MRQVVLLLLGEDVHQLLGVSELLSTLQSTCFISQCEQDVAVGDDYDEG